MGLIAPPPSVISSDNRRLVIEGAAGAADGEVPKWNAATQRAEWGAAGGGGAFASAELSSSTFTQNNAGLEFGGWGNVYQGDAFYDGLAPELIIDIDNTQPAFSPREGGWYSMKWELAGGVAKAGAPARFRLQCNEGAGGWKFAEQTLIPGDEGDFDANNYSLRMSLQSHVFYLEKWVSYPKLGVDLYHPNLAGVTFLGLTKVYVYITKVG